VANVAPFRVTQEDLAGLDRKTQAALQPLLEALNVTLGQIVSELEAQSSDQLVSFNLTTGAVVADSFPLVFKTTVAKPVFVDMVCNPKDGDHAHTDARVMQGFQLTDAGLVSIPFITGLLPDNSYQLTFRVR
jgi:hypothetical protein